LFEDIAWSTERVSVQTLARARELGLHVHQLPPWYDVDDIDALRLLIGELFEERPFVVCGTKPTPASWARRELRRLLDNTELSNRLSHAMQSSLVA
jgi:hypothetical protein